MKSIRQTFKKSAQAAVVVLGTLAISGIAAVKAADSWAGSYSSPHGIDLTLRSDGSGDLIVSENGQRQSFPVSVRQQGNELSGTFSAGGSNYPLTISQGEEPQQIVIYSEGTMIELSMKNGNARSSNVSTNDSYTRSNRGRNVSFNGVQLDDATLATLEGPTPVVPNGDYWYDNRSGMAGTIGGPAEAYLAPGLNLGGKLSPQASGGATQVVLNGRHLHPTDLAGLQYYFGYIAPGRYWMDGNGDYGFEGGQKAGNIIEDIAMIEMAAQYQAQTQQQVYGGQGGSYGGGGYNGGGGSSVYSHFPNLGASGTGVSSASFGNGDGIVNAGGVLWWPGK